MNRNLLMLSLLPLVIAACSTDKVVKPICPQTAFVRELERISDYGAEQPKDEALVASAKMNSVDGACNYSEGGVDVNFSLKLSAERSPRLGGKRVGFPFFVSIIDPENEILSKELMTADFKFEDEKNTTEKVEQLHVFIPLAKEADGASYQVLMGFQLTEDQLNAVRKADESIGK